MNNKQIWVLFEQMQGEIAAEIRVMLNEGPYSAALFDQEQRNRRIEAMKKCASENTSDEERHKSWMEMHLKAGWVYGETFDPAKKTHPNLVEFDKLPHYTKSKARIFDICSKTAKKFEDLLNAEAERGGSE